MIYTIRTIRKNSNFLPAIAGIALMTITACASANLGEFSKETQDAAVAAARAEAATAQRRAVDAVRCTTPICDNVVKADDLLSYPTAAASGASTFLTIAGTEITTTGVTTGIVGGQRNAPILRGSTRADICEARGGDEATCAPTKNTNTMDDGFRYFSGQFNGAGNTGYFAGILPTTNLGAPLTSAPAETEWDGTYSLGGTEDTPIEFNIDFANRRITAEHNLVDGSSRFNLGFSDSGVISGVVLQHEFGLNTNVLGFANATGLIGTEGLVGVFVNSTEDPAGLGFHGGF
ncbi:MAG: hypothetical protein K8953_09150, partial [Proteobacteria bacterium]|nr:hypothetical protein [Pseudomonadota bacterium]